MNIIKKWISYKATKKTAEAVNLMQSF